jgi:hypothetical protein
MIPRRENEIPPPGYRYFTEVRLTAILGSSPPALWIAPVLYSRLSYVECGGFIARHT